MGSAGKAARGNVSRAKQNAWQAVFLAALANTSNVAAAARQAKVASSTVYELRRKDAEFNRRWQVALCEGYDNLEIELLQRLRTGEIKPLPGSQKSVRSFDNATALRLLAAHRESTARERAYREHVSAADVRASIERKVEALRKRVLAEHPGPDALPSAHADSPPAAQPQLPAPENG